MEMKTFWYMARRFKAATALNIFGLTIAFTVFYLLMTQIDYSRSYNSTIPDAERVFRVETKMGVDYPWGDNCNRPFYTSVASLPQVESISELFGWDEELEFIVGEDAVKHSCKPVNLTPFGAIGAHCLDGKLSWDSYDDHSAIIPASLAMKLFGRVDVAGEPLFMKTDSTTIRGVYADFPVNCSMKNFVYFCSSESLEEFSEWSYIAFVKLSPGIDADTFMKDFPQLIKEMTWKQQWGGILAAGEASADQETEMRKRFDSQFERYSFRLNPIREVYFSGVASDDKGNPSMLLILELSCVLVLIIAIVNFLNFTLAESPMRIKSINTRRVLGESIAILRLKIIAESVVTSLLACVFAFIICCAIKTQAAELLLGSLALSDHPYIIISLLLLAVLVGVAAGAYPAFFATSFQPALALKASFGLTPKGKKLRSALVTLQLGIALLMVTYICILLMQSRYIYNSDYGFDKDEVLYAGLTQELWNKKTSIRSELLQLGGVVDVSYSRFVLGAQDKYMGWGRGDNDHHITFTCMPVDYHYLRTMGIKVVEGRDFNEHDGDCYIINEAARRQWPWVEINKNLLADDFPVIGVCEDIRFFSTRKDRAQEPLAFIIFGEQFKNWGDQLGIVNIRVAAGVDKVSMRKQIIKLLTQMGDGKQVEAKFLDQQLEQLYQEEFRFISQVEWFAFICLVITLIGVFCLTMFETEYRRKEIGIRKVMGASTQEIIRMFCIHYARLLLIGFVVAAPLAWYLGNEWLKNFAERTPVYWWLFPIVLLMIGLIIMTTVIIQSWRTASENPVNSIKTE